jgi:hypothetical protein
MTYIEAQPILLFSGAGVIGMIFAYLRIWSYEYEHLTFAQFFFGYPHATGRAITTLGLLIAGAGGLDYLSVMTHHQIIIAGFSLGLIVPERVKNGKIPDTTAR